MGVSWRRRRRAGGEEEGSATNELLLNASTALALSLAKNSFPLSLAKNSFPFHSTASTATVLVVPPRTLPHVIKFYFLNVMCPSIDRHHTRRRRRGRRRRKVYSKLTEEEEEEEESLFKADAVEVRSWWKKNKQAQGG